MEIKITFCVKGMRMIDMVIKKAEEIKEKNPHAEISIEVQV